MDSEECPSEDEADDLQFARRKRRHAARVECILHGAAQNLLVVFHLVRRLEPLVGAPMRLGDAPMSGSTIRNVRRSCAVKLALTRRAHQ